MFFNKKYKKRQNNIHKLTNNFITVSNRKKRGWVSCLKKYPVEGKLRKWTKTPRKESPGREQKGNVTHAQPPLQIIPLLSVISISASHCLPRGNRTNMVSKNRRTLFAPNIPSKKPVFGHDWPRSETLPPPIKNPLLISSRAFRYRIIVSSISGPSSVPRDPYLDRPPLSLARPSAAQLYSRTVVVEY